MRRQDWHALLVDAQSDLDVGLVVTEGFRVLDVNEAFAEMVGYPRATLTSGAFDFRRLRAPGDGEPGGGRFTQLDPRPKRRFDARLVRRDGRPLLVEGASKSMDIGGQTVRVSVVRDVTEQRRAQRALLDAAKSLEHAERLGTVSALLEALAHEIRTPLTYVLTSAHLVRAKVAKAGGPLAVELEPHLELLDDGVSRVSEIVGELTGLPEAWPGGEKSPVSLQVVARDTLRVLRRFRGATFPIAEDLAETPAVLGNRTHLQQAIIHLLRNAKLACDPGEPSVRLATGTTPDGAAWLRVEDEGCGMPCEVQERMYDPLFTMHEGRMGFGLTIVRAVVLDHGGQIACESHVGEGTRFTLTFPPAPSDPGL